MPQNQNHSPFIDILEHDDYSSPETKRVQMYGWDATNLQKVKLGVNSDGSIKSPTPTADTNPSETITETLVGSVLTTVIQKVIGATTYTKTIVENYTTGVTTVSAWS